MQTWPEKFVVLRDNFQETPVDRVIRSNMDVGPAKKRRRTVLGVKNITFTAVIELDDYDEFEEFYLANDVGIFYFKHPRTGELVKARFVSVPTGTLDEVKYTVSIQLEIMP